MGSRFPLACFLLFCLTAALRPSAAAQTRNPGGGSSKSAPGTTAPAPNRTTDPNLLQPTFVSGKVTLDGGGPPPQPVAIERICNGTARREGYTDAKGQFQLQIGANTGFQDASESSSSPLTAPPQDQRKAMADSCEFRALLPGYESTTVMLRTHGSSGQFELGTIFLKPMAEVKGSTISATSMTAPGEARSAFEKAEKKFQEGKLGDAEKYLSKAVDLYPGYAAAWSLLGDIHSQQDDLDLARKEYSQALAADPQFVSPVFGLALVAMREKRWADVVRLTDQVVKLNAFAFPSAYFYNAVANYNSGALAAAEDSARRFKNLDSDHKHPDVCLLLADILASKQDYSAAAAQLREYMDLAPDSQRLNEATQKLKRVEQLAAATAPR